MERPALQRLLVDIAARRIDIVVVYKVDRLTRALSDFARIVELFDRHKVSFVSVTQAFNTTTSMGRRTDANVAGIKSREQAGERRQETYRAACAISITPNRVPIDGPNSPKNGPADGNQFRILSVGNPQNVGLAAFSDIHLPKHRASGVSWESFRWNSDLLERRAVGTRRHVNASRGMPN